MYLKNQKKGKNKKMDMSKQIPGQMHIEDYPEYLPDNYLIGGVTVKTEEEDVSRKKQRRSSEGFLRGKKVIVLVDYDDASLDAGLLENMLPEEFHYLVNVPKMENPEFAEAVKRIMGDPVVPTPEEIIGAVHETQGQSADTPPRQ